jgi:hypothetical protein
MIWLRLFLPIIALTAITVFVLTGHLALCFALDPFFGIGFAFTLRAYKRIAYPYLAFMVALFTATSIAWFMGHKHSSWWLDKLSAAVYFYLVIFGGRGFGKKIASKLKSVALTAIDSASYRRQQAEAFR